jgi:hypothetical protein
MNGYDREEEQHCIRNGVQRQLLGGTSSAAATAAVLAADNSDPSHSSVPLPFLGPSPPPASPPALSRSRTVPRDWRRRSADVGGLHLATKGLGQGQGWMGGDPLPIELRVLFLLHPVFFFLIPCIVQNNLCGVVE